MSVIALPAPAPGIQWTSRAAYVTDVNLSFENWQRTLRAAGEVKRAMSFIIGDLILFGDGRYGERYAQAIEATGLAYETLASYAWVCEHVRPNRRRETLGFGHHKAVAPLEPAEQSRWLGLAEERDWNREELRQAIKDATRSESSSRDEKREEPARTPQPEILPPERTIDVARGLSDVRETLTKVESAISPEGAEALGLPRALRAVDEAAETVVAATRALARAPLVEVARRVVKEATRSSGFAMVPAEVWEEFVAVVAAE